MANVLNRTTKEYLVSVNTPDYDIVDWIHNPDLSAVDGYESKYWVISGDNISLMSVTDRDAIDAAEIATTNAIVLAKAKAVVDGADPVMEKVLTAISEVIQDELQAIKAGTPLASRNITELKRAVKDKIDG